MTNYDTHKICNTLLCIAIIMGGLYVLSVDPVSDWYALFFAILGFLTWSAVASTGKSDD